MLDLLRYYPITKKALAEAAGVSPRHIEEAINRARQEGVPIVSDSEGYRLSHDPAEVMACSRRLRSRAINQLVTSRALRRSARRLEGYAQERLWAA